MRKALLLSGSLGMGHDVMAQACADSLQARGWSTLTLDAMRLLGRTGGSAGAAVFPSMLAIPRLFHPHHLTPLRNGSRLAPLPDPAARRPVVPPPRPPLDPD